MTQTPGGTAARPIVPLVRFELSGYVRAHRVVQPFVGLLGIMIVLYSTRVNPGQELSSYADSAVLLVPVFAWAARGLLDTQPDVQRLISITTAGNPRREVVSGLLAAAVVNAAFALLALLVPLGIGFAAFPGPAALAGGLALQVLAVLTGTALGALTSRPIIPDPATSALTLLGGYAAVLLVSLAPVPWLTVPLIGWMRAANGPRFLTGSLPGLAAATVFWSALALHAYVRLRRTRP
ncbi:hypothetical protein [Sphaerisporangium fuscum]|uniref:hypothetical protein n=1 Tax=Sphaerisporangium fuscum TaxID=2835868 RepID=UPI001BDC5C5D|nr:hypothetical protein [Sphaerisporangium fuscum]